MRNRRRDARAVLLAVVFAVSGLSLAYGEPPSGPHPADDRVRDEGRRERQARDARGSDAEQQRLRLSRRAYAGVGLADAIEIAKARHPELLLLPAWRAPSVPPGGGVESYINDFGARLSDGTVVQSTVPLRADDETGRRAPVDLALADGGGYLSPRNPIARIQIARRLDEGVSLRDPGVRLVPAGAVHDRAPVVAGETAFFHDAYADGDYIVKPTTTGFSVNVQIRSEDSPERYALAIALAAGRSLRERRDRGLIEVLDGDKVVASITAPRAWDADHDEIDVTWSLEGSRLVMNVPHREHGGAYPYLLDPTVTEWFDWEMSPGTHDIDGWEPFKDTKNSNNIAWHHGSDGSWLGDGLYAYLLNATDFNDEDSAGWYFRAPGTASVNRVEWNYVTQDWTDGTCIDLAIHKPRTNLGGSVLAPSYRSAKSEGLFDQGQQWDSCGRFYDWYVGLCNVCAHDIFTPGNAAVYAVRFDQSRTRSYFWTHVGRAYVHMYDRDVPTVADGGIPKGWGDWPTTTPIPVRAGDGGLGIRRFTLSTKPLPAGSDWDSTYNGDTWSGKAQVKQGPNPWALGATDWCARIITCPQSFLTSGNTEADRNAKVGNLPDGVNTLTATAEDPAAQRTQKTYTVKVDRSASDAATIGGTLFGGEATGGSPWGSYTVTAALRDRHSGVKSWDVLIDGASVPGAAGSDLSCFAASGCPTAPPTKTFTVNTTDLRYGEHTLTVRTVDAVQNPRSDNRTFHVTTDTVPPEVELSGPATDPVNPGPHLRVDTNDNIDGNPGTGMKSVEVLVDGVQERLYVHQCSGGCPLTWGFSHTIDWQRYGEGAHTVSVVAKDDAGNPSAAATTSVYVALLEGVDRSKLGLEEFLHYSSTDTGAGTQVHVNAHTGNAVWHSVPIVNPGRGLSTVVNLTYNSHDRGGVIGQQITKSGAAVLGPSLGDLVGVAYGEVGHGFSLGISGVTRLNEPLAGVTTAAATGEIVMTDPDGTAHTFTDANRDGIFDEPPGVHLRLRRYSGTDPLRRWAITRPDGVTFFFDAQGYATRIQDRHDNAIEYEYQSYSKLDGSACPASPSPALVCAKRVVNVVDAAGVVDATKRAARSLHIEYVPGGVLSVPPELTSPPTELSLVGGRAGRISTITDHADRVTKFAYDSAGYLIRLKQGAVRTSATAEDTTDERIFVLTYDGSGANRVLDTVRDPRGATTDLNYETAMQMTPRTVGPRVREIHDRRGTRFGYTFTPRPEEPGGMLMTVADPARGNLPSRTDPEGRPRILRDGRGTETRLEFDTDNNVSQLTEAYGLSVQRATTMTYNAHGQLLTQTDAEGRVSTLAYKGSRGKHIAPSGLDAAGAWVSDLELITPPKGNWTRFTLDPANTGDVLAKQVKDQPAATTDYGSFGLIEQETDEAGNVTRYESYDDNGLPQTMFDPRDYRWAYTYDDVGNVRTQTDPRGSTTADLDDYRTELFYDPFDRVIRTVTPKRSAVSDYVTRETTHDDNGNVQTSTDGNGDTTTFAYTAMDEVRTESSPPAPHYGSTALSAEVTTFAYDDVGRMATRTAPLGSATTATGDYETTFTYDRTDNVVVERRVAADPSQGTPPELVTSMQYDRFNNLVATTDPKTNATGDPVANVAANATRRWLYTYDKTGNRLTATEDPGDLALKTQYGYDLNENLETEISPRGFAENRLAEFTTTRGYDTNDLLVQIGIGNRTTRYDRRGDGRIVAKTAPQGVSSSTVPDDFVTTYDYYSTGELRRWTLPRAVEQYGPADRGVTYTRNEVGDAVQITDPRDRAFVNTFFDTGELRSTGRPSWWTLGTGQGDASDTGLDPASDASGSELLERPYTDWLHDEAGGELPEGQGHGDFGAVGPQEMPSIVPRAGTTWFEYDAEMRLTAVVDAAARRSELVRDPLGRVLEEHRAMAPDLPDLLTTSAFDRNGNLRRVVDPTGEQTTLGYDQYDRLISENAPGAAAAAPEIDQPGSSLRATTRTAYDANGNVTDIVTPRGTQMLKSYDDVDRLIRDVDAAGGATTFSYDANANATLVRGPRGNETDPPSDQFATTATFNQFDEVATETDGLGNVTTYTYDRNGNQTRVAAPGAATTPGGTPAAHVIDRQFDGRDLLWTERTGSGAASRRVTVTEYDPNGNLRRMVNSKGVDDATRRPLNADATQSGGPPLSTAVDATVYDYSAHNQLIAEYLPRGTRDAADGALWRRTLQRDSRGRVEAIDAPWVPGQQKSTRTEYTHFDTGWIRTARDRWYGDDGALHDRQTSTYEYDGSGRQTAWLSSSGREVRRSHYPNGLLRQRRAWRTPQDLSPRTYTYGYNANGSMTQTRDFELVRLRSMQHDAGERLEVVDERWTNGRDTAMSYDRAGNLSARWTDTQYLGRNADGSVNVTGGKRTAFTYDALDREETMRVTEAGRPDRETTTTYWPSSAMRSRTKPNRTVEDWHYFDDGRVNRMRRHRAGAPEAEFVENQVYHYDENGNRDIDERGLHEFNSRDQLVRWTPVWGDPAIDYVVNGAGAVVSEARAGMETKHHYEGDRLEYDTIMGASADDYAYDKDGNLESIDRPGAAGREVDYKYDEFGRMVYAGGTEVAKPERFGYDGLDRRDWRCLDGSDADCSGGQKYDVAYIGVSEQVSLERAPGEGTGTTTRTYDYDSQMDPQGQDAGPTSDAASRTFRPYTKDANGSVEGLEGSDGLVGDDKYEYEPYGELRDGSEAVGAAAQNNPLRFEGFYYDAGIKSYDMQARPYRPEIGRFLTEDRFESSAGDFNLQSDHLRGERYAFAGGNPVNHVEWDGHQAPLPNPCYTCDVSRAAARAAREWVRRQIEKRRLNRAESKLCTASAINAYRCWKVRNTADEAIAAADRLFTGRVIKGKRLADGTRANAFQHAYWLALMTKLVGAEFALKIGEAHEAKWTRKMRRGTATRRRRNLTNMDLHNNLVGARFARHRPKMSTKELCEGLVKRLRETASPGLYGDRRLLVFLEFANARGRIVGLTGMGGC